MKRLRERFETPVNYEGSRTLDHPLRWCTLNAGGAGLRARNKKASIAIAISDLRRASTTANVRFLCFASILNARIATDVEPCLNGHFYRPCVAGTRVKSKEAGGKREAGDPSIIRNTNLHLGAKSPRGASYDGFG